MSKANNIIDLKSHPLYIKKVMKGKTISPFGAPIPAGLIDLGGFYEHYQQLEELNKEMDYLNDKMKKNNLRHLLLKKKLDKMEEELKDKDKDNE